MLRALPNASNSAANKGPAHAVAAKAPAPSQIQQETQEKVGDLIEQAINVTKINQVVLAGGYGLNCVANYYFQKPLIRYQTAS